MALKARVTDLETVPEEDRKHYPTEANEAGFFVVSVEGDDGFGLEDVGGLRKALSGERSVTTKLQKLLEPLVESGIAVQDDKGNFTATDLEKVKGFQTEIERLTAEAAKPSDPDENLKKAMEAREERLMAKQSKDLSERDDRIKGLLHELDVEVLESQAVNAINDAKGNVTLLLPHVMKQLIGEKNTNGRRVARVKNEDGDGFRLTEKSGSTDHMGVDEFVATMKNQKPFAGAFAGSGASGGGASGTQGGTGGPSGGKFQISATDAQDPLRYQQVRKQATEAGETVQIVD